MSAAVKTFVVIGLLCVAVIGCKDRSEKIEVPPVEKPGNGTSPVPIAKEENQKETEPFKIVLEKPADESNKKPAPAAPIAGSLPSPLDGLDRNELTPIQRQQLPPETVAVIPTVKGATALDIDFALDGKRMAISKADGTLEVWDLTGARPQQLSGTKLDDDLKRALRIAVSPDGDWLAAVHGIPGTTLSLWKIAPDGALRFAASRQLKRIDQVGFHPNSKLIIFGSIGGNLAEVGDLRPIAEVVPGVHSCYTFAPDGRTFASVVFNPARNGDLYGSEIKKWNLVGNNFQETHLLQHNRLVKAIAMSPDGTRLAAGDLELKIRIWDLRAEPPAYQIAFSMPHWLKKLYFTPDGANLIAVANANEIVIWNMNRNAIDSTIRFQPQGKSTNIGFSACALAPDSRHIALALNSAGVVFLRLPLPQK